MFSRSDNKPFLDLSAELADELDWKAGILRTFDHHLDITAWAYEAVSGLLAIGTGSGAIDVYGGPGVDHRIQLSERVGIRSLHFASSLFRLLAVDERDRLNVWDLSSPHKPKLQSIVNFRHPVTCVAVSPSHTHAFIALANGEIQTYDLLCSRKSPYTAPNMWRLYEQKALASGMPSNAGSSSQLPLELVIHPRDLNLLFVAYGGGIILSDLTQRNTLRAYEYVLPPGAPGGAGYLDPQLLTHRRPDVTSIAVHPCGHFFAVGYVDGSIVFWAIEDEDKPLLALTIEGDHDVNIADANRLDEAMSDPHKRSGGAREPIFKLAWSGFPNSQDPRGGHTVLSVLGGLKSDDVPGVTAILLPPFNPPEPLALGAPSNMVHPDIRTAMRLSVTPANLHTYSTVGTPQDFLLLPRDSPHFSGSWDPHAILLLSDGSKGSRVIEAYQFPPPVLAISKIAPNPVSPGPKPEEESSEDVLSEEIAATLESMKLNDDPKSLILPPSLWNGPSGVVAGALVSLDKEAYGALAMSNESPEESIRLEGGAAWVEDLEGQMKLIKFQPHRILVTYHSDLTIRFRDLSSQLLLSGDTNPMQTHFPNLIPSLTIDVLSLLADASVASHVPEDLVADTHIVSAHLATQSLECAVVLVGGEVAVFRLGAPEDSGVLKTLDDPELISAAHILPDLNRRFHPLFLLTAGRGPVSALSVSDIGFIAVAYKDGSLFVIDMRGPRVIKREMVDKQSHRRSILHRQEVDVIQSLTWTVVGTDSDIFPRVRLLAVRESGYTAIYALSRASTGDWTVNDIPEITEAVPHPLPGASFVINVKSGTKIRADRSGLAEVLGSSAEDATKKKSFWISAGAKGVKCVVDITGDRVGKADWPSKAGRVERVAVIKKSNVAVLVAHTDKREALIYSLPFLEHMHSLQLPQAHPEPLSADDTGDYIEWLRHPNGLIHAERYGTLFNVRRSAPYDVPSIDFTYGRGAVPSQPQPVSVGPPSIVSSFLGYITSKTLSGDQIDALLAGPDRPIPVKQPPRARSPEATGANEGEQGSSAPNARNITNSASAGASSLYNRLGNALAERGEMLSGLQESFDALEAGSKNMVSQAKALAAQQTAKRWFQF